MKSIVLFVALLTIFLPTVFAQGVPAPYTMRLQPFLSGFSAPVFMTSARDGTNRLFIVQQGGIIRLVQPGSTTPTDFINITSRVLSGGERGLLGLAFHPQFTTNGRFYVNYTRQTDGATIIAEYTTTTGNGSSNTGNFNSERILLNIPQPFSNHNGGMIAFGPDNFLHIGLGDGGSGNDPGNRAQNRANLLGKMLRIDVNSTSPAYAIPPTNPFTGANTTRCDNGTTTAGNTCQEIYAIGMRNPWRWSFDRLTGQLWAGDVGQGAREEVDTITSGANYGWRVYEGINCTGLDPSLCIPANYTPPVFDYDSTGSRCSITGGYVYRGPQGNLPTGSYVYGDYCTGEILLWINNTQTLLLDTSRFIVSFAEDEDGEIYVIGQGGTIEKIVRAKSSADFDGDLRTDVSIFRPSTGVWWISHSSNNTFRAQQWGLNGDVPTPEDFDGDNISDIAVYRPSTNVWYAFNSSNATFTIVGFGLSGDIPTHGDFDGDARADIAIYRPSTGSWWIRRTTNPNNFLVVQFGLSNDIPTAADFDGDGRYDLCHYRPSEGIWYRLNSTNGAFIGVNFGLSTDIPTPGDFDGDGRADQAVYRPSTGVWYLQRSTSGFGTFQWGVATDVPVVGDYDADGRDDIAVFRSSNGIWYLSRSTTGIAFIQWGTTGDLPSPTFDTP